MKNSLKAFLWAAGRIMYVSVLVLMIYMISCITACSPGEKKQTTTLQGADSIKKQAHQPTKGHSVTQEVFPGRDSFQQGCELIQDQAEALLEEYYRKGTREKRQKQIVAELHNLNRAWKQQDCGQVFGYMIPSIPAAKGK